MSTPTAPMATGQQPGGTGLQARARGLMTQIEGLTAQPAARRALPAIAVLLIVALGLVLYLALSPADRVTLQNGLPEAEKARAMELLQAQGFDARLDPSSGVLTVGAADYHRARMALAAEGLPQGTPDGMDAITDMPLGTSRSVEAARLRRMLELDLARSIAELQPVRAARVHLALPERSAFLRDREPASASVVVQMAPGMALSARQVQAIVGLVAGAVPEMTPDAVSVVDQAGRLLSTPDAGGTAGDVSDQMRQQREMEQMLRERVLALVTPIVGAGNAAVEVTLDMDFTRAEVMREDFLPEATALRSEQGSFDGGATGVARGIPGAISNAPPPASELVPVPERDAGSAPGQAGGSSSFVRNYEVSRQVETRVMPTATVTRINAAVLLRAPDSGRDGAPAEMDPALVETIAALSRTAIGYDEDRGDTVTVSASPFVAAEEIAGPSLIEAGWLQTLGRTLAQLAVLAILVLGVVRPLITRLLPQAPSGPAAAGLAPPGYGNAIEVGQGESLSGLRARLLGGEDAGYADLPESGLSYEEKATALRHLGQTEAGRIASVISGMLAEGEESRT